MHMFPCALQPWESPNTLRDGAVVIWAPLGWPFDPWHFTGTKQNHILRPLQWTSCFVDWESPVKTQGLRTSTQNKCIKPFLLQSENINDWKTRSMESLLLCIHGSKTHRSGRLKATLSVWVCLVLLIWFRAGLRSSLQWTICSVCHSLLILVTIQRTEPQQGAA